MSITFNTYDLEYDLHTGELLRESGEVFTCNSLDLCINFYKYKDSKVTNKEDHRVDIVSIDKEKGIKYVTEIMSDEYYNM